MSGESISNSVVLIANPLADMVESSLAERFQDIKIIKTTTGSSPDEDISKVDVVASWFPLQGILPLIHDLKWFQAMSAGYDHILNTGLIKGPTKLSHAGGIAAEPVAEMAIAFMLGLVKHFPEAFSNKQKRIFPGAPGEEGLTPTDDLNGKTVGILGVGYIGKAIGKKAKALDMKVIGFDKLIREAPHFEQIYSDGELDRVLADSDFVVISLPLLNETRNLITEREIHLMKKDAFLINMARGLIVNREDFIKALKEGWIAGGATDVFWDDDPALMFLEPDDELWDIPNLIITPHNAAFTPKYIPRFCELFCENMEKFIAGEPLINQVNLK